MNCNTRKSRDKRERRHTVGLLVGAYPCGTIVIFDELYGSESISQVYGILIEYFSNLTDPTIKEFLYDDCCHMKRFAEKPTKANLNEITKFFADMSKHVDKFHFKNHIDKWCQENCDPNEVKDLEGVNTPVCEQLFKKINQHANCKAMNGSRFFLFWIYLFELHNLDIEGLDSTIPDPRCPFRWENIKIIPPSFVEED